MTPDCCPDAPPFGNELLACPRDTDSSCCGPASAPAERPSLIFHINYIKRLLTRQKRDLRLLTAATTDAAGVVAEKPHLLGRSALAALQGALPAFLCFLCSVDSTLALVDRIKGEVEATDVDSDKDEERSPPHGAVATAASAAYPCLDRSRSGLSNSRPISDKSNDPFVDTSPETACEPSPQRCALQYHPDVTALAWPKIYMGPPSPESSGTQPHSRRVVLCNLPPDTNLAQVLRAICCFGGIISATMVPSCRHRDDKSKAAMVEFVYPDSAAAYVRFVRHRPATLTAGEGTEYEVRAWLIPTRSYSYTLQNHNLLEQGVTRAISLRSFPLGSVWHFLCLVGTRHITGVWCHAWQENLVVEFTSLLEARRAECIVACWCPGIPPVQYVSDSTQGSLSDMHGASRNTIKHVSPDHLDQEWNRAPYNQYRFTPAFQADNCGQGQYDPKAASPMPPGELAASFGISPSQLSSYLAERDTFQDTEHRIVGSTIKLTRHAWSWSISSDDDLKLLMANTLHEPEWADEWDQHFAALGTVNLRTWERYGMLARHRRQKAAEQGMEEWRVPQCGTTCEWGCCDIKAAPVPRVVKKYFDEMRRVPAASGSELGRAPWAIEAASADGVREVA